MEDDDDDNKSNKSNNSDDDNDVKKRKIFPVHWPYSCPHPEERHFLSVTVGNTMLKWALHETENFAPNVFWRTPFRSMHQQETEGDKEYLQTRARILQYLPKRVLQLVYPHYNNELPPPHEVAQYMALRGERIPAVTVYILSTNQKHLNQLEELFRGLPCRLYVLEAKHFYNQLPYPTIGIDRVVACKAVGKAALIFDGGTALTHTVVDGQGRIVGGGVGPGLQLQFDALAKACHNLPSITPEQVQQALQTRLAAGTTKEEDSKMSNMTTPTPPPPLPVQATNTPDAILSSVLRSIALFVNDTVQHWQSQLTNSDDEERAMTSPAKNGQQQEQEEVTVVTTSDHHNEEETIKVQDRNLEQRLTPRVFVTGSDAKVLATLLSPDVAKVVEWNNARKAPPSENAAAAAAAAVIVDQDPYLLHRGIQALLLEKTKTTTAASSAAAASANTTTSILNPSLWGLRVARYFGDTLFRGLTVLKVSDVEDLYWVCYDDGDQEELTVTELYDALMLYSEVGEANLPVGVNDSVAKQRQAESSQAAALLAEQNGTVGEWLDERECRPTKKQKRTGVVPLAAVTAMDIITIDDDDDNDDDNGGDDGTKYVGQSIWREFDGVGFEGTVKKYRPGRPDFWFVRYLDGDEEDLEKDQLLEALAMFQERDQQEPKKKVQQSPERPDGKTKDTAINDDGKKYVGRRVWKDFDGVGFEGTVKEYLPRQTFWFVQYDDGDSEEMEKDQLLEVLALYQEHRKQPQEQPEVEEEKEEPKEQPQEQPEEDEQQQEQPNQEKAESSDL